MKTLKFEVSLSIPAGDIHRISPYKLQESLAATARHFVRVTQPTQAVKIIVTEKGTR
jgi:hypothetical protein